MQTKICLFWFRRDLRLEDNAGLYYALKSGIPVLPLFIFDTDILSLLSSPEDRRVSFIHAAVQALQAQLVLAGSSLLTLHGSPATLFRELLQRYDITAVYTNHDYEPGARQRDSDIAALLQASGISFHSFKDQVIFEKDEIIKDNGQPYTVFTPYSRKWLQQLGPFFLKAYPSLQYVKALYPTAPFPIPSLKDIGFQGPAYSFSVPAPDELIIRNYDKQRDFPAIHGTSRLSVHLRFGTLSIRALAREGRLLNDTWLKELIWRDFYMAILYHFPHVTTQSFKKQYDRIQWRNNEQEFEAWCHGRTGYPIVDAGMRELNATGFMHNRVRMIVASFLCKHLLIDWRWGEAYFAEQLLDYDLAANNGGWQWAAGSGCDAAPYFRIFNPYEQTRKFDPQLAYIRKWVPELDSFDYPQPIVDHKEARERALRVYKAGLAEEL